MPRSPEHAYAADARESVERTLEQWLQVALARLEGGKDALAADARSVREPGEPVDGGAPPASSSNGGVPRSNRSGTESGAGASFTGLSPSSNVGPAMTAPRCGPNSLYVEQA